MSVTECHQMDTLSKEDHNKVRRIPPKEGS